MKYSISCCLLVLFIFMVSTFQTALHSFDQFQMTSKTWFHNFNPILELIINHVCLNSFRSSAMRERTWEATGRVWWMTSPCQKPLKTSSPIKMKMCHLSLLQETRTTVLLGLRYRPKAILYHTAHHHGHHQPEQMMRDIKPKPFIRTVNHGWSSIDQEYVFANPVSCTTVVLIQVWNTRARS